MGCGKQKHYIKNCWNRKGNNIAKGTKEVKGT